MKKEILVLIIGTAILANWPALAMERETLKDQGKSRFPAQPSKKKQEESKKGLLNKLKSLNAGYKKELQENTQLSLSGCTEESVIPAPWCMGRYSDGSIRYPGVIYPLRESDDNLAFLNAQLSATRERLTQIGAKFNEHGDVIAD